MRATLPGAACGCVPIRFLSRASVSPRYGFLVVLFLLSCVPGAAGAAAPISDAPAVILVVGAAGEAEFGTNFVQQAEAWIRAGESAGATVTRIGLGEPSGTGDRERLQSLLASEPPESPHPLWLVLIGHGTWDDKEARFNLRGPDVSATEIQSWLQPLRRPVAVINTASASAPFLKALAATNRVVITATRSGAEQNVTRFGLPFAEALQDPSADLDRDGQVSLLEAFLLASRQVAEFYETRGRLATEHALLEDTGDGLGTPADWFRGVRATKQARDGARLDGALAHSWVLVRSADEKAMAAEDRIRRDALERDIEALRARKASLESEAYYQSLESLLLDLARVYERSSGSGKPPLK